MAAELAAKSSAAAPADAPRSRARRAAGPTAPRGPRSQRRTGSVIVGGSLGATHALLAILERAPGERPSHSSPPSTCPSTFTRAFAKRLDAVTAMQVQEAHDGDRLQRGVCLVVPGDHHAVIQVLGAAPARSS